MKQKTDYKRAVVYYFDYDLGQRWYVEFWAYCPKINKLRRKRIYRNKFKTVQKRMWQLKELCYSINEKLNTGWTPFSYKKIKINNSDLSVISAFESVLYILSNILPKKVIVLHVIELRHLWHI